MSATIESAVRTDNPLTKQGVLQKLFAFWFDAFVYNQIWEDPQVDLEALQINAASRVLTISSGGCNALNYLCDSPESVTAIDLNRHHIFLLKLKIAALQNLPDAEDLFNFFGRGQHGSNIANFDKYIVPNLDIETRDYWKSNGFFSQILHGNRINYFKNKGLYDHSRNGHFLRFFHKFSRLLGCKPEELLKAKTLAEQAVLFEQFVNPFFDSLLIKTIGKLPITMFGLGIPPQQYAELKNDLTDGKTVIDLYRERIKKLAVEYPIADNYFAWQAFARKYDVENRRAIPEYLKAHRFAELKRNAAKITAEVGSITDKIKNSPKNSFNRFVFLDAQDWMTAETMTELWSAIVEKAEPQSRIIFRTASQNSRIETNLPPELRAKLIYEKELSKALFAKDRVSIYGGFHLYILK